MPDRKDILFRARMRLWFVRIHPHVDVAGVPFILVSHPILERSCDEFADRTDALDGFTALAVANQNGDTVGRMKIRADILSRRGLFPNTGSSVCHGLASSFRKMALQSNRSASGLYPWISRTSEINRRPGRRSI